jgi:hypothetical protein
MLREQIISFLEAVVVFLLFTNALSAVVATYALWMANGVAHKRHQLLDAAERKVGAMLRRAA